MEVTEHAAEVRRRLKRGGPPRERRRDEDGTLTELVVDDARCERRFEAAEADRRREAWDDMRDVRLRDRNRDRENLTTPQRLEQALARLIVTEGGMRSRSIAAIRPSSADQEHAGPPRTELHTAEATHALRQIEHHIRELEAIIDSEDGLLRHAREGDRQGWTGGLGRRMMSTEDRDRIVWDEFEGIDSAQVAATAPYLGTSARTIERARKNEAERRKLRVRPKTGEVLGPVEELAAA